MRRRAIPAISAPSDIRRVFPSHISGYRFRNNKPDCVRNATPRRQIARRLASVRERASRRPSAMPRALCTRLGAAAKRKLNERERQIFLARTLEEVDFETLGVKFELSYKGAAALYYRTIQKIRKSIEGGDKR